MDAEEVVRRKQDAVQALSGTAQRLSNQGSPQYAEAHDLTNVLLGEIAKAKPAGDDQS